MRIGSPYQVLTETLYGWHATILLGLFHLIMMGEWVGKSPITGEERSMKRLIIKEPGGRMKS